MATTHGNGFTLIELLVVVTIVVLLLSLMAPALDRAIYQAELAVCSANMKSQGSGVLSYTSDNSKRYPTRSGIEAGEAGIQPRSLTLPSDPRNDDPLAAYDDRLLFRQYLSVKGMQCPLGGKVDLDSSPGTTRVYASYAMWFGWHYPNNDGMERLGDKLVFGGKEYSVLMGDWRAVLYPGSLESAHPDPKGVLISTMRQDQPINEVPGGLPSTFGFWYAHVAYRPGPLDLNYGYDDGSVRRFDAVQPGIGDYRVEPRFDQVPWSNVTGAGFTDYLAIPNTR